jgi:hypothetical protein
VNTVTACATHMTSDVSVLPQLCPSIGRAGGECTHMRMVSLALDVPAQMMPMNPATQCAEHYAVYAGLVQYQGTHRMALNARYYRDVEPCRHICQHMTRSRECITGIMPMPRGKGRSNAMGCSAAAVCATQLSLWNTCKQDASTYLNTAAYVMPYDIKDKSALQNRNLSVISTFNGKCNGISMN